MSVVQRCPNCGTTQATAGECDACHDAQVRFFCTVHETWLDAARCPTCEARKTPAVPPRTVPPARPATVARPHPAVVPPPLSPSRELTLWSDEDSRVVVRSAASGGARWLGQLVRRLALIAVILLALLAGAIYVVVRSL